MNVQKAASQRAVLQAQTVTRSWIRQCSKRFLKAMHASTQRLPRNSSMQPMACSTTPWAPLPCQWPCDPTALRCPQLWKPTPSHPLIITCSMCLLLIRVPSQPGTPQTHGYPPRNLPSVKQPLEAHSQVCQLVSTHALLLLIGSAALL